MGFRDVFKGDSRHKKSRKRRRSKLKPQYNKNIARNVSNKVKALVPFYGLTENIIAEQCLEMGTFYMVEVTKDPEKLEIMKKHLIGDHYSDTVLPHHDVATLRLGEEASTQIILERIKVITVSFEHFRRAVMPGRGTYGADYYARNLNNLLISVEKFCQWAHNYLSGSDKHPGER